jgi:hypothetical protein
MGGRHADPKLLEAARRLAPVIRQYNEEAEQERRMCPPLLAPLHERLVFRNGGGWTRPLSKLQKPFAPSEFRDRFATAEMPANSLPPCSVVEIFPV